MPQGWCKGQAKGVLCLLTRNVFLSVPEVVFVCNDLGHLKHGSPDKGDLAVHSARVVFKNTECPDSK